MEHPKWLPQGAAWAGGACARIMLAALGVVLLGAAPSPPVHPATTRRVDPPSGRPVAPLFDPSLVAHLEDPARDDWQRPATIVRLLALAPGQTVADIGAGSGYLLPYLSLAVGPRGTVLAQEIQAAWIPYLERRAAGLGNVRVVIGRADEPGIADGGVDCFVLLTTYHEIERPVAYLRRLARAARPGARLAIIDFDRTRGGHPPPPGDHDVEERHVQDEVRASGRWRLEERHDVLSNQFYLVFRLEPTDGRRGPGPGRSPPAASRPRQPGRR